MYYADTSNVEAVHSALRISEETHGSRTTRNLGSDEHISRLKRSAVEFSSMNLGYIRRTKVPRRFAMDPYSELSGRRGARSWVRGRPPDRGWRPDGSRRCP